MISVSASDSVPLPEVSLAIDELVVRARGVEFEGIVIGVGVETGGSGPFPEALRRFVSLALDVDLGSAYSASSSGVAVLRFLKEAEVAAAVFSLFDIEQR